MGRHKTKHKHLPTRMRLIKGRYYWHGYVEGKRPSIPLGADFLGALAKYRELEGIGTNTATVARMIDRYILKSTNLSASTMTEYNRSAVVLKEEFEGFSLDDVRPKHVAQFLNVVCEGKVAGARHVSLLSAAWNDARSSGLTDLSNPCTGIRRPPTGKRKRTATEAERLKVMEGGGPIPIMVELALLIGVRQGDIRTMRVDQCTDAGIEVTPSKTKKSTGQRLVFEWSPALRACIAKAKLLRHKPSSPYLFQARGGEPYTKDGFQTMWKKHLDKVKVVGLTFNDLRRTAINQVDQRGGSDSARAFAGHASVKTTERYLTHTSAAKIKPTK